MKKFAGVFLNTLQLFVITATDPVMVQRTVLEVEVKGTCELHDVSVEPSIILVPGQIIQDTIVRRKFKVFLHTVHLLHCN